MSNRGAHTLAMLGAVGLAVAAWLLWPANRAGFAALGAVRVCMVDASASVARARPQWRAWAARTLEDEARAAREAGDRLLVLAYARDVERCFGPARADELDAAACIARASTLRDDATDLDAALASLASAPDLRGSALEVRILGDRTFTGVDPSARLAALGPRVEWLDPPAARADVALVALRAPREVEVGAPLSVVADLVCNGTERAGEIDLEVVASGATEARRSVRVALDASAESTSARVDLGAAGKGVTFVRATARLVGGDPIAENDSAGAVVRSRGALELAFVGAGTSLDIARRWAACANALPGLAAFALEPRELADGIASCDAVVTLDVDPRTLPHDLLAAFVRGGGAWLACGGYGLLAGWSAVHEGDLAALLPLEVDDDASPREVLLTIDGSGSMAGEAFEQVRRVAPALLFVARGTDHIALRFFTDRLEPARELGRGPSASVQALLEARVPGGPTDVARSLDELARERRDAPMLALLLTDGRDQRVRGASAEVLRALRGKLAAARIELAVIAVGDADLDYLADLAGDAAHVRRANDERALVEAFARELARGRVREDAPIELLAGAPRAASNALADELRAALGAHALPPLERSIRARARAGDELLIATRAGEPAFALRRVGAGWTATWTSWPSDEWAPAWRDACAELAPVLRGLARGRGATPHVEARIDGNAIELTSVPLDWPVEIDAMARELQGGDLIARAHLGVPASGAGDDPRSLRRGQLSSERSFAAGVCELALTGASGWSTSLPCALPMAEEFSPSPRRVGSFPVVSAALAGERSSAGRRAGAWLLGLALLALGAGAALGALRQTFQAAGRSRR